MRILLTNDDGINARGINLLYECLSLKHEVYVIAPNEEKSGCSSAITMKSQLKIETISENKFAVHGFTADCVNIGLKGNIIPKVELVISGINHGPNCGDDVYFSGTVAGARVGCIYGISSIAISIDSYLESPNLSDASEFLLNHLGKINFNDSIKPVFLNINYPDLSKKDIQGIKYTALGKRDYRDSYRILYKDYNEIRLQFSSGISEHDNRNSDITELKSGYISITPLTLDSTDYEYLNRFQQEL